MILLKNALIITYHFPPMPAIGGVWLYGLAKYLPECGWNPIVLTHQFYRKSRVRGSTSFKLPTMTWLLSGDLSHRKAAKIVSDVDDG